MEVKQGMEILNQAVQIALGNGAFKNTKDVAIIHQALEVVAQHVQVDIEPEQVTEPTKKKK